MPRSSRPITVTLGALQERVEELVASGAYASASEVMRAAVRALDREEAALNHWLKRQFDDVLDDPRSRVPVEEMLKRLESLRTRADRSKAGPKA